jgi:hypothetical protein
MSIVPEGDEKDGKYRHKPGDLPLALLITPTRPWVLSRIDLRFCVWFIRSITGAGSGASYR